MHPNLVLALTLAALGAPALGHDHPHPHAAPDLQQRETIVLTADEADHILTEMHLFLAGVQMIVSSAAANDMKALAGTARELGMAATHDVPAELRAKLPAEFRRVGHATHTGFDDLARDAESLGDANHALRQLGQVMVHCNACHAAYRLEIRSKARQ